jgi:hypothetical protein
MYNYVWPERPSFASSYACRFLPRSGTARFSNVIFSPIYSLLDIQRTTAWVFSVGLLLGIWYLLENVVPICFLNSRDGQYLDRTRVITFTIVFYMVISAIIISSLGQKGCSDLEEQARSFLYDSAPPIPSTLIDSANELKRRTSTG